LYNDRGEIRQCNQGGYEYSFYEKNEKDKQFIILEIAVPRYLDTSQIDVDLNPTYVRIDIKGKFLQLTFPCEISVNESQAKRSQANGSLQLVMKKLNNSLVPYFFMKEELDDKNKRTGKKDVEVEKKGKKEGNEDRKEIEKMGDKGKMKRDMEKWEDDPDVPPLE
jgi:protein TilB